MFAKSIYNQCKVTVRRILSQSVNPEIRNLYGLTSSINVPSDSVINSVINSSKEIDLSTNEIICPIRIYVESISYAATGYRN